MFSLCFDFLLLAVRDSLKDSFDYTLNKFWDFCEQFVCFRKAWQAWPAWPVIHTTDRKSNDRSLQMRIVFKGFFRLSLVWIVKQCGWPLVSSSSIIIDERDCRGKSKVCASYLAAIRKDTLKTAGLGDTSLPLSTMVSVPRRGFEGEINRKKT